MNAKKRILLLALVLSMVFTKNTYAVDYEQKLTKINSDIRCIRCAIKKDKQFVERLKKDIELFKELECDMQNVSVCETYKSFLVHQKTNTVKEIKNYKKKLKKYLRKRKKIKKKIKYLKLHSFNGVQLQYSKPYNVCSYKLNTRNGVVRYNGHRETYYSQRVLPGGGLRIPGRHVADDGTIRDSEGYICVAANPNFYPRGSKLMITLGPAKVYDSGCAYGTIDVYVNW